MSQRDVVRRFVTERLAAVTREILEVVDGIVAGYEEEAAGFREEIEQQRRQLEVLLQGQTSKTDVKDKRSLGSVEVLASEREEEGSPDRSADPEDSADQIFSRPSGGHGEKRKPGGSWPSETQNHVDVRIRILQDSDIHVLSSSVVRKYPLLKLKCPRGLKESDFLELLKSTFPQLSGDNKRFDILTPDERRRLRPAKLRTLITKSNHGNISRTGRASSTLYIRLKSAEERQGCEAGLHQRSDSPSDCGVLSCDETVQSGREEPESCSPEPSLTSPSHHEKETQEADEDNRMVEPAERKGDCGHGGGEGDGWSSDTSNKQPKERSCDSLLKTHKHRVSGDEVTVETSSSVLSCRICGALQKSQVPFVEHAWSHVDNPGSVCAVCGELFQSTAFLKNHLQSCHGNTKCHICGESFVTVPTLVEKPHECRVFHDPKIPVSLEGQGETVEVEEELKVHRGTPTNTKMYLCGECGKSLCDYRSLSRHKMTHSEDRPHGCRVCGRRFKLPWTLRQHEKIHTDRERSYLCDVCCKMFLTNKQLQIHLRTHTNEKPYRCAECGKGFTTRGPLTIHMRVHTGETPYRCPDCSWSFKRKLHLDNHMRVHSGHKPFVCGTCGKACARKTYLTVHMRTHNGERPYKCTVCDKAFTQSHCLKTHMKRHLVAEAAT